ncbi:hypothetical protein XENTR_v10006706 [Xenopus tropicalis]|nr:hypothetical protein XENTR_v10006706 [Xenopus tropicalis]
MNLFQSVTPPQTFLPCFWQLATNYEANSWKVFMENLLLFFSHELVAQWPHLVHLFSSYVPQQCSQFSAVVVFLWGYSKTGIATL